MCLVRQCGRAVSDASACEIATEEHPAQTQLITDDQIVGYVTTVKRSGAIPRELKRNLLRRIEKLSLSSRKRWVMLSRRPRRTLIRPTSIG